MNEANAPSPAEVEALRRRLAAAVFAVVDGGPAELPADVAQVLQDTHGIAYVCLRRGGRALAEAWSSGHQETWAAALCQALSRARGEVTGARASVDAVEVCLGLAPEQGPVADADDDAGGAEAVGNVCGHRDMVTGFGDVLGAGGVS